MKGQPITDEQKNAIIALYRIGRKKAEIVAAVNLSESAVRKVLIEKFGKEELIRVGFMKYGQENGSLLSEIDNKILSLGQLYIDNSDRSEAREKKNNENLEKWLNLIEQHLSLIASAKQEELQLLRQISKHTK